LSDQQRELINLEWWQVHDLYLQAMNPSSLKNMKLFDGAAGLYPLPLDVLDENLESDKK